MCCCKRRSAKGTKYGEVLKKHNPWGSPFNLPWISLFLKKILWVISHQKKKVHTKRFLSGLLISWDFATFQECPDFWVPFYKNQNCRRSPKIDTNLFTIAQHFRRETSPWCLFITHWCQQDSVKNLVQKLQLKLVFLWASEVDTCLCKHVIRGSILLSIFVVSLS